MLRFARRSKLPPRPRQTRRDPRLSFLDRIECTPGVRGSHFVDIEARVHVHWTRNLNPRTGRARPSAQVRRVSASGVRLALRAIEKRDEDLAAIEQTAVQASWETRRLVGQQA